MALTRPSGPTANPAERQNNPKLYEVLDEYADAIEGGGPTTNYDLAKARDIPLLKERSQTVTLDTGENQIHGFVMAGGKLFACTLTAPAKLIRFNNLEDLTDRTVLTFASDGFHDNASALVHVTETDRLYVMFCHASRTTISEVNPATMTSPTDAISDTVNPAGTPNGGSICSDGTNLYIVTLTSPSKVLKYRISDFALLTTATLTSRDLGHAILYDGVSVFATGGSPNIWVAKIHPTDLTFTDAALPSGAVITDDLASDGDYLFAGRETSPSAGKGLLRISKDTLAYESLWSDLSAVYALHFDGRYLWVGHGTSPGKLSRVDPQSGEVAVHTFATGENAANEIVSDGGRLFVTFYMSPAKVKRLVPPALPTRSPGPAVAVRTLSNVADANTGASEQTLLTAAVGGILSADAVGFRVTASGWFAGNANAKRILLKFGLSSPVAVFDTGSLLFNDTDWTLEALCTRTGSNAQKWVTKWTCSSALLATKVQRATTTQVDTGALNVNVRGVGVADDDVTNELLFIETVN